MSKSDLTQLVDELDAVLARWGLKFDTGWILSNEGIRLDFKKVDDIVIDKQLVSVA